MSTTEKAAIKPCTVKELATLYGVSTKTLRTWLEPHRQAIGERVSRYYTALQLEVIFNRLGTPPSWD